MAGASGLGISLIAGGSVAALLKDTHVVEIPGLGAYEPWQMIFIAVGLPGLLVSLMFFLTKEPERREKGQASSSMDEFVEILKSRRAIIVPHFAGVCVYFIQAFAFVAWMPAFIMRIHGWSIAQVGVIYGSLHVACAIIGGITSGWFAGLLWKQGRRDANLRTSAILMAAVILPSILGPLVPDVWLCLFFLGIAKVLSIATAGPNIASIQEIIPNRFRGRINALYFAILSLVGVTLGPLVIGIMNDYVFTDEMSIGKSLALTTAFTLPVATVLLFIAARNRLKLDWAN
jgi:MFS family permease